MCIAQFNLHLVVLVVAILPVTRPAIASHNLARFNPGINPGIPRLSKLDPEIPGLVKRSGIAFPRRTLLFHRVMNLYNADESVYTSHGSLTDTDTEVGIQIPKNTEYRRKKIR